MKNLFLIVLSIVLSLAVILPSATMAMADSEKSKPALKAALMIKNPGTAEVNQPVTITVFGKHNHQPVAEAQVYALQTEKIASMANKKYYGAATNNTTDSDYLAFLAKTGIFLGETNAEGNITPKFANAKRYMLVAFKTGYIPGFSQITITLPVKKGLQIRVPGSAQVGSSVNMTVIERRSQEPVVNVAVYARKIGEPKPQVPPISNNITKPIKGKPAKVEDIGIAEEVQNIEQFQKNGILLGYTNDNGALAYTANETGRYALAAIKEDYKPGFARIVITPAGVTKALIMKLPGEAIIGETVPIAVRERRSGEAVAQASIYALRTEDVDSTNGFLFKADPPSTDITAREKFTEVVKAKGGYIGSTDNNGILFHEFAVEGHYILVTVKNGYTPDFARIHIKPKITVPQKSKVVTPPKPVPPEATDNRYPREEKSRRQEVNRHS